MDNSRVFKGPEPIWVDVPPQPEPRPEDLQRDFPPVNHPRVHYLDRVATYNAVLADSGAASLGRSRPLSAEELAWLRSLKPAIEELLRQ